MAHGRSPTSPTLRALVERVAGQYGFGPAQVVVDRPGEHDIVLDGERESTLTFGTALNATLSTVTGCHLPEGAGLT